MIQSQGAQHLPEQKDLINSLTSKDVTKFVNIAPLFFQELKKTNKTASEFLVEFKENNIETERDKKIFEAVIQILKKF